MSDTDHMDIDTDLQPQENQSEAQLQTPVDTPVQVQSTTEESQPRSSLSTTQGQQQQQQQQKKRFEIKKWTAVAFWSWDIAVDNCAICRNHIMEPCIECQPKAMTDTNNECVAAWGTCNHAFHLHCINKWIKTRDACPLDNQKWQLARCGR